MKTLYVEIIYVEKKMTRIDKTNFSRVGRNNLFEINYLRRQIMNKKSMWRMDHSLLDSENHLGPITILVA